MLKIETLARYSLFKGYMTKEIQPITRKIP